jgi:predicted XRE-type DNA-binding protein
MITRDELLKSSDYWVEIIQNKIYNDLAEYIESNKIPNKQIAEILGLSKGRVSQILSGGNLNFRLDTLVKLCLTIDKIPDFHLIDVNDFISKDKDSIDSIIFEQTVSTNKNLNEMLGYKPSTSTSRFNIELNSFTTISGPFSLPKEINPKLKAA